MKPAVLLLLILCLSCNNSPQIDLKDPTVGPTELEGELEDKPKQVTRKDFQHILDSLGVRGSILIYQPDSQSYFSNDFAWAEVKRLPASTFKITNSIIALETGVVENDSTFFKWDGQPRRMKFWERDMNFKEAFQLSCLPCYQEVARAIGVSRMRLFLDSFNYPGMQVDSASIDQFWILGESGINQFEQINFLQRLRSKELPVSPRTWSIMRVLMNLKQTDSYTLYGKTGWAIKNGENNGWFVGYAEKEDRIAFFAVNITPRPGFDMSLFFKVRKDLAEIALKKLNLP